MAISSIANVIRFRFYRGHISIDGGIRGCIICTFKALARLSLWQRGGIREFRIARSELPCVKKMNASKHLNLMFLYGTCEPDPIASGAMDQDIMPFTDCTQPEW
jgi:hypothetical protein